MTKQQVKTYLYKVTFRLSPEAFRALEARGASRGISPHQMARDITERALNGNDEALLENLNFLAERIAGTEEEVKKLREEVAADLGTIVAAIREKIPTPTKAAQTTKGGS